MKLKLDSIVLFALLVPFIMNFRISPGDTPYLLFGIIFFLLISYIVLDLEFFKIPDNIYSFLKIAILWILIFASIGSGLYSEIIVRHQSSPIYHVHDIVLQQEAAVRFLLHGINPYATTYFNTPLSQWNYSPTDVNPALYHFVMQPLYLIFAVPFYLIMSRTFGFFDARVSLFILFLAMLFVAQKIAKTHDMKRLFVILLAFNPATLSYLIEGRDDIFMYAFLLTGFFLLLKNKYKLAGVGIACAFAIKQSAWPLFPLYFFYVFYKTKSIKKTIVSLIPFSLIFLLFVLPFVLWNPKAFLDSTVFYLSGNIPHSYPIAGYGFGMILHSIGVIKDVHIYYPFWVEQVIFAVPILIGLILWIKKSPTMQRLVISYGIFLFVFWYFSRYFNNSHVGFLSTLFITAFFLHEEKKISS